MMISTCTRLRRAPLVRSVTLLVTLLASSWAASTPGDLASSQPSGSETVDPASHISLARLEQEQDLASENKTAPFAGDDSNKSDLESLPASPKAHSPPALQLQDLTHDTKESVLRFLSPVPILPGPHTGDRNPRNQLDGLRVGQFDDSRVGRCDMDRMRTVSPAFVAPGLTAMLSQLRLAEDSEVREYVVDHLARIVRRKGDGNVITALLSRLRSETVMEVRCAIAKALGQVPVPGSADVIAALSESALTDEEWSVRQKAVEALGQVTEKGDGNVIAALLTHLTDEKNASVRISILEALAEVVDKKEKIAALSLLSRTVRNPPPGEDARVRVRTVNVLAHIAEEGDEDVIAVLVPRLTDDLRSVRQAVARALGHVAKKGDANVIAALADHLPAERFMNVQEAIVEALSQLAEKGNTKTIAALSDHLTVCHFAPSRELLVRALAQVS